MTARPAIRLSLLLLLCFTFVSCGSNYMLNRKDDLKDMFDGGITSSEDGQFAFYMGFFNILTVGYSSFDGTLHGICGRNTGDFPAHQHGTGLILWGWEELGYDGSTYPLTKDTPDEYAVGPLGLVIGPWMPFRQVLNCPKLFHFGYYGFALNCHFTEFADFFLGWVGLDIYDDDVHGVEGVEVVEETPAEAVDTE